MSRRVAKIVNFVALAAVMSAGAACGGSTGRGATRVPYSDPNAVGYLALCNRAGEVITSGSVNSVPFVWRAVSSEPAAKPYNNPFRTAILLAYQPQEGLEPTEWTGEQLTASTRYSNPSHPMAEATTRDQSLNWFLANYAPRWDGFVQLRLYLGTADEPEYSLNYPALNIQVIGRTWHVVDPRPLNCKAGIAESIESMLLPPKT